MKRTLEESSQPPSQRNNQHRQLVRSSSQILVQNSEMANLGQFKLLSADILKLIFKFLDKTVFLALPRVCKSFGAFYISNNLYSSRITSEGPNDPVSRFLSISETYMSKLQFWFNFDLHCWSKFFVGACTNFSKGAIQPSKISSMIVCNPKPFDQLLDCLNYLESMSAHKFESLKAFMLRGLAINRRSLDLLQEMNLAALSLEACPFEISKLIIEMDFKDLKKLFITTTGLGYVLALPVTLEELVIYCPESSNKLVIDHMDQFIFFCEKCKYLSYM